MSNIPLARLILAGIKKDFIVRPAITRRLNKALANLHRRPQHIRTRALGTRAPMTPALEARIKRWYHTHPTWDQQRIAEKFNVTDARVSVALWGKNK
jgi:hypothetical protein